MRSENTDPLIVYDRRKRKCDGLRDLWRNCNGFLVGGGPSLKTVDYQRLRERGICSIAVNNVAGMVPAKAFVHGDPAGRFHDAIWADPGIMKFSPVSRWKKKPANEIRKKSESGFAGIGLYPKNFPNVWSFEIDTGFEASRFLHTNTASFGRSLQGAEDIASGNLLFSFFFGLRLAHYLGLKSLYLLGVDFAMSNDQVYAFSESKGEAAVESNNRSYLQAAQWVTQLAPILEAAGMKIFQTNSESRLDCFPVCSFSDALNDCRNNVPEEPLDLTGWYESAKVKKKKPALPAKVTKTGVSINSELVARQNSAVLPESIDGCLNRGSVLEWIPHGFRVGKTPVLECSIHGKCTLTRTLSGPKNNCLSCQQKSKSDTVSDFGLPSSDLVEIKPKQPPGPALAPLDEPKPAEVDYAELYRSPIGAEYGRRNNGKDSLPIVAQFNPASLVDIGCGWNEFCRNLPEQIQAVGVDIACSGADIIAPAWDLPFANGAFDLLTCFDALEHIAENRIPEVFTEFARVSRQWLFSISYRPSRRLFQGQNLHATVQPEKWWICMIESCGGIVQQQGRYLFGTWKVCQHRGSVSGIRRRETCPSRGLKVAVHHCSRHEIEVVRNNYRGVTCPERICLACSDGPWG